MRVVLDANVLVSAALTPHGQSGRIVEAWRNGLFQLCCSEAILREFTATLAFEPLQAKYGLTPDEVRRAQAELRDFATMPAGPTQPIKVVRDPKDNMVIECAVACGADLIVTNDDDLLALKSYEGIGIVTIRDFLRTLGVD